MILYRFYIMIGTQRRAGLNAYNYSNNTFTIYKHDHEIIV